MHLDRLRACLALTVPTLRISVTIVVPSAFLGRIRRHNHLPACYALLVIMVPMRQQHARHALSGFTPTQTANQLVFHARRECTLHQPARPDVRPVLPAIMLQPEPRRVQVPCALYSLSVSLSKSPVYRLRKNRVYPIERAG